MFIVVILLNIFPNQLLVKYMRNYAYNIKDPVFPTHFMILLTFMPPPLGTTGIMF